MEKVAKPVMKGHRYLFIHNGLAHFCELKGRPVNVPCIKGYSKEQWSSNTCQGCEKVARRTPYLEEQG